ncbi:hypothetical protein C0993_011740, partial [Termitomyces sp. T159_Od127]
WTVQQLEQLKVQMTDKARAWLKENGALTEINEPIDIDILKETLCMLTTQKDALNKVKEGIRAVLLGMDELKVGEMCKGMMETVEKAMEEYWEVLEDLAEATVKTVKGMVEQAKEMAEKVEW